VMAARAETALGCLYDLETSLYPRTALCKGESARSPFSSACQGRGEQHTWIVHDSRRL
jgi:hypothetical protein